MSVHQLMAQAPYRKHDPRHAECKPTGKEEQFNGRSRERPGNETGKIESVQGVVDPGVSASARVHHGQDLAREWIEVDSRGVIRRCQKGPRGPGPGPGETVH